MTLKNILLINKIFYLILCQINDMTKAIFEAIKLQLESKFPNAAVDAYMQQAVNSEDVPLWTTPSLLIQFYPTEWHKDSIGRLCSRDAKFTVWHVTETGYDDGQRWTGTTHLAGDDDLMTCFLDWSIDSAFLWHARPLKLIENVYVFETEWQQITNSLVITKTNYSAKFYNYASARNLTCFLDWSIAAQINVTQSVYDSDESESVVITFDGNE